MFIYFFISKRSLVKDRNQVENLVESTHLQQRGQKIHTWDTSFTYTNESFTHTTMSKVSDSVRTHTKVPMDDQAAYSTRMRAWHGWKGEGWTERQRRKQENGKFVFEGTLKIERARRIYFPPGTSEYQSLVRVSHKNMRADSHRPSFRCHQKLNRSYRDPVVIFNITIIQLPLIGFEQVSLLDNCQNLVFKSVSFMVFV